MPGMEVFIDLKKQRDLVVKVRWGHTHDFGDLRREGRGQNRHIELLANFHGTLPDVPF